MRASETLSFSAFERLCRAGDLIPVFRTLRGDADTPVSAFLKLGSPSHAFLLESVVGGERWGRFSFLGDRPRALLKLHGRTSILEEHGKRTFEEEDDPLDAIRRLLSRYTLARPEGLPRFLGGLVGTFGYGAVSWFEPRVLQRHGPDPAFPDGEFMLADRLIVFDNLTHRLQLVSCTYLPEHRSARAAYRSALASIDELEAALARKVPREEKPSKPTHLKESWPAADFERAVRKAKAYIAAGDCMQVVLSRRLTARYAGAPFELYRALRADAPTPHLFYLRFGDRVLAGASPELLVRVEDGKVSVRPLAGTRPRGKTPEEDASLEASLRADPKERAEHVMLLDLGRNDVGRIAAKKTVRVVEREQIERYSHVMHLVSQVTGELRPGADGLDVVAATFPAGTVSGAPKVRAMEIIDELEPCARGPYAGAVGYVGFDGTIELAIAIRTVALAGKELRLQAGAGIVHDSDPAKELAETSHKLAGALEALGLEEGKPARSRT